MKNETSGAKILRIGILPALILALMMLAGCGEAGAEGYGLSGAFGKVYAETGREQLVDVESVWHSEASVCGFERKDTVKSIVSQRLSFYAVSYYVPALCYFLDCVGAQGVFGSLFACVFLVGDADLATCSHRVHYGGQVALAGRDVLH